MTHIIRLRFLARVALLGLLVFAVGCGKRDVEAERVERFGGDERFEYTETIGFAQGLNAKFGSRYTSPQFINNTPHDLTDVDVKITFTPRDEKGKERVESASWATWRKGETITPDLSVEKNTYKKVFAVGTAKRDGKVVKLSFGVELLGR